MLHVPPPSCASRTAVDDWLFGELPALRLLQFLSHCVRAFAEGCLLNRRKGPVRGLLQERRLYLLVHASGRLHPDHPGRNGKFETPLVPPFDTHMYTFR